MYCQKGLESLFLYSDHSRSAFCSANVWYKACNWPDVLVECLNSSPAHRESEEVVLSSRWFFHVVVTGTFSNREKTKTQENKTAS